MNPPKRALQFLRWFCREDYLDEIEGDIIELFEKRCATSPRRARINFYFLILRYFRPEFLRTFRINQPIANIMLRHNLVMTVRSSMRYRSSFFINLIGLSTGIACTLMIYLWVKDELTIDQHHDPQLYRVMENRVQAHGIWTAPSSSGLMADAMAHDFPEVERAVTVRPMHNGGILSVGDNRFTSSGNLVSREYLKMFRIPMVAGDMNTALSGKGMIVLSETRAKELFESPSNAMGKQVDLNHENSYMVTGVFKDFASNSSIKYDYLLSFDEVREEDWLKSWFSTGVYTYVTLRAGTDVDAFNGKLGSYIIKKTDGEAKYRTPFVQRYSESYLHNQYTNGILAGGRIDYVKLFSIIAVFILAIACINFMNLSTARASRRMKEVGIKKSVGAGRKSLIVQYLSESTLMATLSMIIGVLLVALLLPQFNLLASKNLSILSGSLSFYIVAVALTILVGIIAGSYPALYLSRFKPAAILKASSSGSTKELGNGWARRGLVVLQFTVSVVLIISVLVVYKQVEYTQSRNIGYERDNIISFQCRGKLNDTNFLGTFLTEVRKTPGVENASSIGHSMVGHDSGTHGIAWPGKDPENKTEFENMPVDYDMLETLGVQLAAGRLFDRDFGSDTAKVIFNETAIKFMGIQDPIGKIVQVWGQDREIVGIVKDFNFQSFHEPIKPVFFRLAPDNTWSVMVKIEKGKEAATIQRIKELHHKENPAFDFDYSFLDENYRNQYAGEQRVAVLSRYFAGLAILISCLGLFGLASFTAERRVKEIGIRKVLGSSELSIIYLLTSEFTKMVVIAIALALPIGYLLTQNWLESFVYRISLTPWYFAGAGTMALLVAWLTVLIQTLKVARINPSVCLKAE